MKKIIVCCADEWTKELLTLARLESIEYFVDDNKMYTRGGRCMESMYMDMINCRKKIKMM